MVITLFMESRNLEIILGGTIQKVGGLKPFLEERVDGRDIVRDLTEQWPFWVMGLADLRYL